MERLVFAVLWVYERKVSCATCQERVEEHGLAQGVKREQSRELKSC
jgi:hypothetical protein